MVSENETWIIETGDVVINKIADSGETSLTETEQAIYCFWVIDYSVRNAGSLGAVEDIYPNALLELNQFAQSNSLSKLSLISELSSANDEEKFCDNYYQLFEPACEELRTFYEHT